MPERDDSQGPGAANVAHARRAGSGFLGAERFIPSDERTVLVLKPHPMFLLLATPRRFVALALVVVLLQVVGGAAAWATTAAGVAGMLIGVQLVWNTVQYAARWYVLTEQRVMRVGGVFAQVALELPLRRIEFFAVAKPLSERVLGLGRVGFASGATSGVEVVWATIAKPAEVVDRIRPMVERAAREAGVRA